MSEVLQSIGASGIVSGIILIYFKYYLDKKDNEARIRHNSELKDKENERASRRQESIVTLRYLKSIGHLSEATAIAQKEGKINGKMTLALNMYNEASNELDEFLLVQNAERNH